MWKCERCGSVFDEPEEAVGCYEYDFGLSTQYEHHNYYYGICPECGSEEIDRHHEDDDEDYFEE